MSDESLQEKQVHCKVEKAFEKGQKDYSRLHTDFFERANSIRLRCGAYPQADKPRAERGLRKPRSVVPAKGKADSQEMTCHVQYPFLKTSSDFDIASRC